MTDEGKGRGPPVGSVPQAVGATRVPQCGWDGHQLLVKRPWWGLQPAPPALAGVGEPGLGRASGAACALRKARAAGEPGLGVHERKFRRLGGARPSLPGKTTCPWACRLGWVGWVRVEGPRPSSGSGSGNAERGPPPVPLACFPGQLVISQPTSLL